MDAFVTMRDGARLWTSTTGADDARTAIILLHGGPGMPDYLGIVAAMLENSHRVHRYEQRGCGRSDKAERYTLAQYLGDLEDLRLHWGHDRWILIGHSWGADLALGYALSFPERAHAIVGIAGGRIHNDRGWSEIYQQNKHREPAPAEGPPNLAVNAAMMEEWRRFCRAPDFLARLARLKTPALFITGTDDIRPTWGTAQVAQLLPKGSHIELTGADHYPWQGKPAEVAAAMGRFLTGFPTP